LSKLDSGAYCRSGIRLSPCPVRFVDSSPSRWPRFGGLAAFYQLNPISLGNSKPLEKTMNPRFDVFRKQTEHLIRWIGTAASLEDVEKLIGADSGSAADDSYLVVHSAYGVTEAVMSSNARNLPQQTLPSDPPQSTVR